MLFKTQTIKLPNANLGQKKIRNFKKTQNLFLFTKKISKKLKIKSFPLKMAYLTNFTNDTGKTILRDIIKTVNQTENTEKLSTAKTAAGKEMIASKCSTVQFN